jgi:hypothetical protein
MSETKVVSFVLRFVQEEEETPRTTPAPQIALNDVRPWRGVVRHVQSREEVQFTELKEALAFMGRFVELGDGGQ